MGLKTQCISVVVPVYFQEKGLIALHSRLTTVLQEIENSTYEIILVNDGSTDRSFEIMKELSSADSHVKAINFSRNFSQQMAISAGLAHAIGDAVVVIDDDLQDPPELIVEMVKKWRQGYSVVYGTRIRRKGENIFKILSAKLFYGLIDRLSDVRLPRDSGDFRLVDRAVVDVLNSMKEQARYIRGLVAWIGFDQCSLPYIRDARFAGKSNYNISSLLRFAVNGLTSFSEKPLVISTHVGLLTTSLSFVYLVAIIVLRLTVPDFSIEGWTSTMIAITFFSGVQLLSLGVIGQYIGRLYREIKQRPLYIIKDKVGFDKGN